MQKKRIQFSLKSRVVLLTAAFALIRANGIAAPVQAQALNPNASPVRATDSASSRPGTWGRYAHPKSTATTSTLVTSYAIGWGPVERNDHGELQWLCLEATKAGGDQFRVWLLTDGYPAPTLMLAGKQALRFVFQPGLSDPLEFRDKITTKPVLPSLGAWFDLFPRPIDSSDPFPKRARYLGHSYELETEESRPASAALPPPARMIELLPDIWVGVPSNTRQKDETRRYDGSDYEMTPLTRRDYREMADAGMNCFKVDAQQLPWIDDLDVFYWGVGGKDVLYPQCFYDSRYLGPALFLDEPAVHTRDYVIRPRLARDPAFRKAVDPQVLFDSFHEYFQGAYEAPALTLLKGLASRSDVDLGDMNFPQGNLFTWETMVSTAAYQLSQSPDIPAAMVFEPPGRVGSRRTIPELNMTYGCQLPLDDPQNLTAIIYGFLRGAARATGKGWGTSIYGAVDRADAFWFLSHAYDLGATRFFFWDSYQLACVPYPECLALARNLKHRAENYPHRDLDQLKRAAEVAILLPPGYNLGHVHLGKGNLWGLSELNLERVNRHGVKYRDVMSRFFIEIERCLRLGVAFDLLWDLPTVPPSGYREVVRIREDAKVEVAAGNERLILDEARLPSRPSGAPPELAVSIALSREKAPVRVAARASVVEVTAPIYYTYGTDTNGVYHNAMVAWELYGPGEEDYRFLTPPSLKPHTVRTENRADITIEFAVDRPGEYRLRAATADLAGRTTVRWTSFSVAE